MPQLEYTTLNNVANTGGHNLPMPDPECYIYLHHVNTLIILPSFAEGNNDSIRVSFAQNKPMSRTAPIFSYVNSGPRSLQVSFDLHRDMMYELNYDNLVNADLIEDSVQRVYNVNTGKVDTYIDYVDVLAKQIQAAALPTYSLESKMVNPPLVSLKLGNDIFIKGVVSDSVGVSYGLPVLANGKYSQVRIQFQLTEVAPYEATQVMQVGSYRGIDTSLANKRFFVTGSV